MISLPKRSPPGHSSSALHRQIIQELGSRIVGGRYPAGESLPNEEVLCAELQVSRTALREAVKVLGAKGLLDSRPRIGTSIRPVKAWNMLDADILAWRCRHDQDQGEELLRQLSEVREIIEPNACLLAARNRTPAELADVESAYMAMAASENIQDWVKADLNFHVAVLAASRNQLLIPLSTVISSALEMLLSFSARRASNFKKALPDHGKVLEAIRAQDERGAFACMQKLLSDTRARLTQR